MSSYSDIEIDIAQTVVCELNLLKKGYIDCANKVLCLREAAMDRLWAMECLIAENDTSYNGLIKYLYEQIKEIIVMINVKY